MAVFTELKKPLYPVEVCVEFNLARSACLDFVQAESSTSDTTIATVVALVMMTALVARSSVARQHMAGLRQIVRLRGGASTLKSNSELRIAAVAADLRRFSTLANLTFATGRRLAGEVFQETLISAQHRLLTLRFASDDWNEGVLSAVDWTSLAVHTTGLSLLFTTRVAATMQEDNRWLIPLLRTRLCDMGTPSWDAVRSMLKSFMWIDAPLETDGREIYHRTVDVRGN
ncbi:hypothetical protein EYZ11_010911 [Aspergillus tanneri]|uniref:Uncharacterized protein n=1 Tax=Aspergillus tanneri TaxID=1220188 RepID=A0A4S3J6C3_9EURO|nr:hypothetical protein EYZ11_010911 [Aspergillus tanneri]